MSDPGLWEKAASCYEQAGLLGEAARCYRQAGAYRRAGDLYVHIGQFRDAADAYASAGNADDAAWILVHQAGDPAAARALMDAEPPGPAGAPLPHRLVLARCDIAQAPDAAAVLPLLAEVQQALAAPGPVDEHRIEVWSIAIAETLRRYDQVALVYAAAVRGRRLNAAQRWHAWAVARLGTSIVLPSQASEPARRTPVRTVVS